VKEKDEPPKKQRQTKHQRDGKVKPKKFKPRQKLPQRKKKLDRVCSVVSKNFHTPFAAALNRVGTLTKKSQKLEGGGKGVFQTQKKLQKKPRTEWEGTCLWSGLTRA